MGSGMNDPSTRAGDGVKEPVNLDPFSAEIMRNYLISTVKEMVNTTVRTAYSTCFSEGEDFTCGLFDRDGNMIAQAAGNQRSCRRAHIAGPAFPGEVRRNRAGRRHHPQRPLHRRNAPGRWRHLSPDVL